MYAAFRFYGDPTLSLSKHNTHAWMSGHKLASFESHKECGQASDNSNNKLEMSPYIAFPAAANQAALSPEPSLAE
jgi:hypothetical protein